MFLNLSAYSTIDYLMPFCTLAREYCLFGTMQKGVKSLLNLKYMS